MDSYVKPWGVDPKSFTGALSVVRERLSGDYTTGSSPSGPAGRYFGAGLPLFYVFSESAYPGEHDVHFHVRANNRSEALRLAHERHPLAKIRGLGRRRVRGG